MKFYIMVFNTHLFASGNTESAFIIRHHHTFCVCKISMNFDLMNSIIRRQFPVSCRFYAVTYGLNSSKQTSPMDTLNMIYTILVILSFVYRSVAYHDVLAARDRQESIACLVKNNYTLRDSFQLSVREEHGIDEDTYGKVE